jgi:hypothetical protein
MGREQEATQRAQQAWDYQQWLRGQEGGARELAFAQSFMPGGMQQEFERRPSRFGQVAGGLLGAGGVARDIYDRFGNPSSSRVPGRGSSPIPRGILDPGNQRPWREPEPGYQLPPYQGTAG